MLQHILLIASAYIAAYLMGSVSSAIIVCKIMGLPDPRGQGSGNPGATNVMRLGGKKAAAITLIGDILKGLIPVLIARAMNASLEIQLLVALAAFIGHLYPVFFNFRGGKGIATALGVLLGLSWQVALGVAIVWILIYKWKKISSLAGLSSAASMPAIIWVLMHSPAFVLFSVAMGILVFWRHRTNISKLIAGTEK